VQFIFSESGLAAWGRRLFDLVVPNRDIPFMKSSDFKIPATMNVVGFFLSFCSAYLALVQCR
jgi:hypothetical protein